MCGFTYTNIRTLNRHRYHFFKASPWAWGWSSAVDTPQPAQGLGKKSGAVKCHKKRKKKEKKKTREPAFLNCTCVHSAQARPLRCRASQEAFLFLLVIVSLVIEGEERRREGREGLPGTVWLSRRLTANSGDFLSLVFSISG